MSEHPEGAQVPTEPATAAQKQDVSRVVALEQRRLWLHHQIQLYKVTLAAAKDRSQRSSDDPEKILEKISQLEKDLVDVTTKQNLKDLILERLYSGEVLGDWMSKLEAGQGDADERTVQHREINDCLQRQMALTSEALKIHQEITTEQEKADDMKKKRAEKMYSNRELLSQIETARKEQESSGAAANNPQLKKARQKLESAVTGVVLLQDTFRGLMLGSGINWAEDEDLCSLAISLGRPISEQFQ